MAAIKIEWLYVSNDCETCGGSYAEGATVTIDGVLALDLRPRSTCFGGESWDRDEVFRLLLDKLGHQLEAADVQAPHE